VFLRQRRALSPFLSASSRNAPRARLSEKCAQATASRRANANCAHRSQPLRTLLAHPSFNIDMNTIRQYVRSRVWNTPSLVILAADYINAAVFRTMNTYSSVATLFCCIASCQRRLAKCPLAFQHAQRLGLYLARPRRRRPPAPDNQTAQQYSQRATVVSRVATASLRTLASCVLTSWCRR
jgi:hypothetical protein